MKFVEPLAIREISRSQHELIDPSRHACADGRPLCSTSASAGTASALA
jgi:hypothetical protein